MGEPEEPGEAVLFPGAERQRGERSGVHEGQGVPAHRRHLLRELGQGHGGPAGIAL